MIRAAALGLALVVTVLLTGCGIVVTDEAPTGVITASAPALLPAFQELEALAPAPPRALSLGRARRIARKAALEVRIPACDDEALGRGFALGSRTLVAQRDVLPGAGWVRVQAANRRSTAVGAASAYRIGELGVARVRRPLPRKLPLARSVAAGASVVVVTERGGKLRVLPGVVVDSVPGSPYGTRAKVLRLTSAVRAGDVGPVLDAGGRIVAVLLAVDPRTTLGVAVPATTLRELVGKRRLEALESCD